ncbi:MAG: hypothetical protein H7249_09815 [Chitinophagaceae bacterium]|nr:hypothetical protein [Oligoflexus sp.]
MSSLWLSACGQKQGYDQGAELVSAVLGGGGANRTTTAPTIVNKPSVAKTKAAPIYNIVNVTQIVEATSGISGWTAVMLPFTGPAAALGSPVTDGQTPFNFNF